MVDEKGQPRPEMLRTLARHSETPVATRAMGMMRLLGEDVAVSTLAEALGDSRIAIRIAALGVLRDFTGSAGLEEVVRALDDPSPRVREAALVALSTRKNTTVLPTLRARLDPKVTAEAAFRKRIQELVRELERIAPRQEAAAPKSPVFVGRLVPFEPTLGRVGLQPSPVRCTSCGGVCHDVLSVPGEQIGRPGRPFRLIRCLDCVFWGPHYVFWKSGQPVRAQFEEGQHQEMLEGKTEGPQASLRWEPGDPPGERAARGWQTIAGGQPYWLQRDEPPACPTCRREMDFVLMVASATLDTIQNRGELSGEFYLCFEYSATLYCFECEKCGVTASVSQCT